VVPLDGSSPPIAVSNGVQVLEAQTPEISWSPDGQKIAFASTGTPTRIYVAQADGSAESPVTDETTSRDLPSWETNGDRVAYRSIETDGTTQRLEAVDPASGEVTTIDAVIGPGAQLSHLAWSPMEDNRAHAVSYVSQMGFGGQAQAVINFTDPTATTTGGTFFPWTEGVASYNGYGTRWSPDGKWIAILTARDGVVLAAPDTSLTTIYSHEYHGELRRLGNVADCWIDWSADGTALYGGTLDGCTGTVVIPVSDPGSAFVTYTPMAGVTSWQPLAP
jgi:WD40 repeat protein